MVSSPATQRAAVAHFARTTRRILPRTPTPPHRGVPAVVWLLTLAQLLLLGSYTVLLPPYRAHDELVHIDAVRLLASGAGWPPPGERYVSRQIADSRALVFMEGLGVPEQPGETTRLPVEAAPPRAARPSYDEIAPDEPSVYLNQLLAHPPAYYVLGAVVLRGLDVVAGPVAQWPFDRVVAVLRLVSVALVTPLPLLAYLTVRRLVGDGSAAVTAAVLPLAVPQATHMGSSVNNDALMLASGAVLTMLLAVVCRGDTRARLSVGVGLFAGVALLTKGFAVIAPVWIALAYVVAAARAGWRRALPAALVAQAVALVAGGWWWVRNLVVYGRIQPSGMPAPSPPAGFEPDPAAWSPTFLQWMVVRFWGSFGNFEAFLPNAVVAVAALLLAAGVVAALLVRPSRARWWRADIAVLLAPAGGTFVVVAYGAWRIYSRAGVFAAIQGRYLFLGLVGLLAATAIGWAALLRARGRALPLGALAVAAWLQGVAVVTLVNAFWRQPGTGWPWGLDATLAWSPWRGRYLIALWMALALSAVAATVALARNRR